MDDQEHTKIKIPETITILPLIDSVLFPKMLMPIMVSDPTLISVIEEAISKDESIGLMVQKGEDTKSGSLYRTGTMALILKSQMEKEGLQLIVQGIGRIKIIEYIQEDPYLVAKIEGISEGFEEEVEVEVSAYAGSLVDLFSKAVELSSSLPNELIGIARTLTEPSLVADLVVSNLNVSLKIKQSALEEENILKRLDFVYKTLTKEVQTLTLGKKIQEKAQDKMDKGQKEFILRQQMQTIKEELGEKGADSKATSEIDEFKKKIEKKNLPEEARKEAERELERLSRMHPSSSEYSVATTYIDWVLSLPWGDSTKDKLNVPRARKILDADHYGLKKVKKRILEYLAVRQLKPDTKGPILCFSGPPGTGKTSLGKSIARALGRKFIRMSLGGVRDESEIRGHRRTYVGALPGRIIQGIRRAGSDNPLFMLDEIDKLGSDFKGDPSSALLEVLDPEQNYSFTDHYLDVPFDLTKVMFITTANVLSNIPPALRDRMEVLELSGYTDDEKIKIARQFLIKRQIEAHGLTRDNIKFNTNSIRKIIAEYTREAGLRNLEREIAGVCRAVACEVVEGRDKQASITEKKVRTYLGPVQFRADSELKVSGPGVVTGMAWTPNGGELLFLESTKMEGRQRLTLTGQMGDVMKESSTIAMSYVRTHAKTLGIHLDDIKNNEIHIHVPAGAIPKDGPSAGVTLLTSLVSLLTDKPVRTDMSMTGEITLRGEVLPVGGVKSKVLAAFRKGMKEIILPAWNEKDLEEDVPPEVFENVKFHFVEKMSDVLKIVFEQRA